MASVASRPMLVQDPKLLQAYSALRTVQAMEMAESGPTIEIPVIVICGTQSSGKTSFIESLIGFPVGHTDKGTATRCPVRMIVRSGPEKMYKVNGVTVADRQKLRDANRDHMINLAKRKEIVRDVFVMEIQEPDKIDIDIIDLPGLKTRDEQDSKPIANITRDYLHDPNVMPVVMCKASESHETQHDLDSMADLGLKPSRGALIVMNYFNRQLGDMTYTSELNTYCAGMKKKYPSVRFVMLHYKEGINKDKMTYEDLCDYYKALPDNEYDAFNNKVESMNADEPVNSHIHKIFGVTSVFSSMQKSLQDWMQRHKATVQEWLNRRLDTLEGQMKELKESLEDQDPNKIRAMWRSYILDYERIMAAIHSAELTHVKCLSRESQFAPKYQWAFTMDEAGVTTTFADEEESIAQAPPDEWLTTEQLREEVPGTYIESILDESLSPHAALNRLTLVAGYMMVSLPMRPFLKEEIRSKSEHSRDGVTHSFNKHTVVKQLVTERLFRLQSILSHMMLHIQNLYEAPLPKVHDALSENYPTVAYHWDFRNKLDSKLKEILSAYLSKANEQMQDCIEEQTRFFGVDISNRLLTLVALTPLRQDMLLEDPDAPYAREAQKEADGALLDTMEDIAMNPTPLGFVKAGMRMLRRTPDVLERRKNTDIPERIAAQRKAIWNVKQAMHKHHKDFCMVDFVEGGLQDLTQEEYRCLNVEEINNDGEQYFFILKCLILLEVEKKLNRHVYEPFKNKLLLEDMTKQMMAVIDEFSDSEIHEIAGGNADQIRDNISGIEEQIDLIHDALHKLQATRTNAQAQFPEQTKSGFAVPEHIKCVVRLKSMDLDRVPTTFHHLMRKAAQADLAKALSCPERFIKVHTMRAGSIVFEFMLTVTEDADVTRIEAAIEEKKKDRDVNFIEVGKTYCQAIRQNVNRARIYSSASFRSQAEDESMGMTASEKPKKRGEGDPKDRVNEDTEKVKNKSQGAGNKGAEEQTQPNMTAQSAKEGSTGSAEKEAQQHQQKNVEERPQERGRTDEAVQEDFEDPEP